MNVRRLFICRNNYNISPLKCQEIFLKSVDYIGSILQVFILFCLN